MRQHVRRDQLANQAGFTLNNLLWWILAAVILGGGGYCAIKALTAPPAPVSILIAGPGRIARGQTAQYRLNIQFATPPNATAATTVTVQVWEDDYAGDDPLLGRLRVTVPAGALAGRAAFSLSCDAATGELVGTDGRSEAESTYHVYGLTERAGGADDFTGTNRTIECGAEGQ